MSRRVGAGCSTLVEDPVYSEDKETTFLISFPLKTGFPLRYNKYSENSIKHNGLTIWNYVLLENLT